MVTSGVIDLIHLQLTQVCPGVNEGSLGTHVCHLETASLGKWYGQSVQDHRSGTRGRFTVLTTTMWPLQPLHEYIFPMHKISDRWRSERRYSKCH